MKTIVRILFLTLIGAQTHAQVSDATLNHMIDTIITKYEIPSMVVSVIKSDTCYYGRNGVLHINTDDRVNLKSKYHLGSNSKAVTSFIAMKLIENGKLELDTRLLDLIPELKTTARKVYKDVTLADLLAHFARIQSYTTDKEFEKLPEITGSTSEQRMQFSQFVLTEKPIKKGSYSNAGFVIASLMMERASGKSFETLLEETFAELGVDYFIGFPDKQNHLYPSGHWMEDSVLVCLATTHDYKLEPYMLTAGDIAMDIVDYSRFVQLHLNGANGNCDFLDCNSYKMVLDYEEIHGLGWGNGKTDKGDKVYGHSGSAGTYYCHTVILPDDDLAVILMTNSAEDEHVKAMMKLRNKLMDLYGDKSKL